MRPVSTFFDIQLSNSRLEGKLDAVRNEKRQYKVRRVPCFKALFMIR